MSARASGLGVPPPPLVLLTGVGAPAVKSLWLLSVSACVVLSRETEVVLDGAVVALPSKVFEAP